GPSGWTAARSRRRERSSLVEDETTGEAELGGGDEHDQNHEEQPDRAGPSELELTEGALVDHHHDGAGGVAGAAPGEHVGLVEDLQSGDDAHHRGDEHGGADQRQGEVLELPPPGGPVDGAGLVDLAGDRPEPTDEQQERETEVL